MKPSLHSQLRISLKWQLSAADVVNAETEEAVEVKEVIVVEEELVKVSHNRPLNQGDQDTIQTHPNHVVTAIIDMEIKAGTVLLPSPAHGSQRSQPSNEILTSLEEETRKIE